MKKRRIFAFLICAFALSSCRTMDAARDDLEALDLPKLNLSGEPTPEDLGYAGVCPSVKVVPELGTYSEFLDSGSTRESDLVSRVTISNVKSACNADDKNITMDLKIPFYGVLGPQAHAMSGGQPFFSYPFFVAVTSESGKILAKEVFAASITYRQGANSQTYFENMRQIIPVEARDHGSRFKILLGFQLNPDQLDYNRVLIEREEKIAKAKAKKAKQEQKRREIPQLLGEIEKEPLPEETSRAKPSSGFKHDIF